MTHFLRASAVSWIVVSTLVVGCSKHDDAALTPSSSTQPSTAASPTTSLATTQTADLQLEQPIARITDPTTQPGVWLSINGQAAPAVPQGAAITIRATALGARGKPFAFNPDGVQLAVTDAGGKPVTWPLKRAAAATRPASRPTTDEASADAGGAVTWVVTDSRTIPLGTYRLAVTLDGAVGHAAAVTLVAPLTAPSELQKTQRFLTDARAAIALGEPQRALDAAEQRLKASPRDVPALHVKADALAAMGRTKDAALAYSQAISQFAAQNPKAREPPLELIQSYQSLDAGK